ncbi:MAG: RNA polymerase sigma factor [Planctomycetes bacterium]|nr:RNA polymerase sigma factor [Planctomycetota bacterium]
MQTTAQMIEALVDMRQQPGGVPVEHFWKLVERFRADLVHQAYVMLRSQADAEDIAQLSLCEAFQSMHTLREPEKLGVWLRGINRRNALDLLRRRKSAREQRLNTGELDTLKLPDGSGPRASTPPGGTSSNNPLSMRVNADDVMKAVESLPENFRDAVLLRYMEGLSCDEIAIRLGVPGGTVRSRLCRADAMLIRKLGLLKRQER